VEFEVVDVDGRQMIALTARAYEALSRNMAELIRWIEEARWRLGYYRGEAD